VLSPKESSSKEEEKKNLYPRTASEGGKLLVNPSMRDGKKAIKGHSLRGKTLGGKKIKQGLRQGRGAVQDYKAKRCGAC